MRAAVCKGLTPKGPTFSVRRMRDRLVELRRWAKAPGLIARALVDTAHPILAQIVPLRRCNLACGYCNEYDKVSKPVPLATVEGWLAKLAELDTEIVTVS